MYWTRKSEEKGQQKEAQRRKSFYTSDRQAIQMIQNQPIPSEQQTSESF